MLAVAAGVVFVLMRDGGGPVVDPLDDLAYTRGAAGDASEPLAATAADIVEASVGERDGVIVLTARMQAPVPDYYQSAVLEITWHLQSKAAEWLVAVMIEDSVVASVAPEDARNGTATGDETFPGIVDVAGSVVTVELERDDIEGFPESFEWFLTTRLAADRTSVASETVRDRAPDTN